MTRTFALALSAVAVFGCSDNRSPEEKALFDVKAFIATNIDDLHAAVVELRDAAPAPDADGWNAAADAAAVGTMKGAWKKARIAYEHVEGAIAVLFPDLDVSTDERYDGFISTSPDDYLFDDNGVTGIHAIERILWSDSIPARVRTFEEGLPGYVAAAFPTTQAQANDFKNKLCARLVTDVETMKTQFGPLALDAAAAYRGVIGSMNEQVEKANKAATGEEESRYAQFTLADMRTNVDAGVQTYAAFKSWVLAQENGAALDQEINAGFMKVLSKYGSYQGDALPAVPATWSAMPSTTDLATPFGQLWQLLNDEADPDRDGSLVNAMNRSADALGIPQLPN